jgi:hypothetical protein
MEPVVIALGGPMNARCRSDRYLNRGLTLNREEGPARSQAEAMLGTNSTICRLSLGMLIGDIAYVGPQIFLVDQQVRR